MNNDECSGFEMDYITIISMLFLDFLQIKLRLVSFLDILNRYIFSFPFYKTFYLIEC